MQVEVNHFLPPPLAYRDMCANDVPGRSRGVHQPHENWDVWGCSAQAAYNIAKRAGYRLLQFDWPVRHARV